MASLVTHGDRDVAPCDFQKPTPSKLAPNQQLTSKTEEERWTLEGGRRQSLRKNSMDTRKAGPDTDEKHNSDTKSKSTFLSEKKVCFLQ